MWLLDSILNLAGVLLWFSWRSLGFDPLVRTSVASLAGTLKPATRSRFGRWELLGSILLLLVLRAWLYSSMVSPAEWAPRLNLEFIVLAFRVDRFWPALLYTAASFGRVLVIGYFWLLFLMVLNRKTAETDALRRLIRFQFGFLARWPTWLQLVTCAVVVAGIWVGMSPLLVYFGTVTRPQTYGHVVIQGFLLSLALVFTLKYLLSGFLLLHLVASYVYLGSHPFWDFVSATSGHVLAPLRSLGLRSSRLDFTPLVGIIVIFLALHALPNAGLRLAQHFNWPIWPQ